MKIDSREGTKFKEQFKQQFPDAQECTLPIGDYIINNTIIERKEVGDFIQSYTCGKIQRQLYDMLQTSYENKVLVITGEYDDYFLNCIKNKIKPIPYNVFIKMQYHLGIQFPAVININTSNFNSFCELCKYIEKGKTSQIKPFYDVFKHNKKSASINDVQIAMISCIPGISFEKATIILKEVSWNDLITQDYDYLIERLISIKGIGKETVEKILKYLGN